MKSVDFVRDKIEMPHGMTTASVVFSADAIEGLPLATLLHIPIDKVILSGWIYYAKKNIEGCNNNLEKTLSEKTEKYNMHQ